MALDTSKSVTQIISDYELIEKLADGGMGSVYKGRHRTTGEIVAIKLVAPHLATNPTYLQRFEKEYTAARALDHPNIVRAIEHGVSGGRPYLVMEFVDGESLGQKIERDGRMPEAEAIRVICLAAQGLHQAHQQGLIHRDIKPDNIMVTPDGQVKILDLGLVKEADGDLNLTRTGRGLGTPHFMSPEQFRNAKNADVRCDIYSLAATLYMMVTGEMPFASCPPLEAWMKKTNNDLTPPRKLVPSISERTEWAIRRSMHSDPNNRPGSCQEFIDDLTGTGPLKSRSDPNMPLKEPWWYLVYKDEEGQPQTVKGTMSGIRKAFKEGRLGDAHNIRVGRAKKGEFEPLPQCRAFQDLFAPAASSNSPSTTPTSRPNLLSTPTTETGGSGEADFRTQAAAPRGPHIVIETPPVEAPPSQALEWLKVLFLIGFAAGTGVVLTLLLRH
jgi:serine/threonine protein kinase